MDAHEREYAAAAAGMSEMTGYAPQRGDVVEVEVPFIGTRATGVVLKVTGTDCEVSLNGGSLLYQAHELRPVARQITT